jgi:DNA-binding NarL/FixJ family response regulator
VRSGAHPITQRRKDLVISLVSLGLKNADVAKRLRTTEDVVKNYLRVIYDELGLWNRVELALWHEKRKFERNQFLHLIRAPCPLLMDNKEIGS